MADLLGKWEKRVASLFSEGISATRLGDPDKSVTLRAGKVSVSMFGFDPVLFFISDTKPVALHSVSWTDTKDGVVLRDESGDSWQLIPLEPEMKQAVKDAEEAF